MGSIGAAFSFFLLNFFSNGMSILLPSWVVREVILWDEGRNDEEVAAGTPVALAVAVAAGAEDGEGVVSICRRRNKLGRSAHEILTLFFYEMCVLAAATPSASLLSFPPPTRTTTTTAATMKAAAAAAVHAYVSGKQRRQRRRTWDARFPRPSRVC